MNLYSLPDNNLTQLALLTILPLSCNEVETSIDGTDVMNSTIENECGGKGEKSLGHWLV